MSTRILDLLSTHKENMVSQLGEIVASQGQVHYQTIANTINKTLKQKSSLTIVGGIFGSAVAAYGLWKFFPTTSSQEVRHVGEKTAKNYETGEKLRQELAQTVKKISTLLEETQKNLEEAKDLKEIFAKFKESQKLLLENEKKEREKMLDIFREVQKESLENQKAIEEKIQSLDEKNQQFIVTLRKLFAPVSEFNQRFQLAGNEMDRLGSTIEKLLDN